MRVSLFARGLVSWVLVLAATLLGSPSHSLRAAQSADGAPIADVSGPGQAVSMPPPQCPRTVACRYAERNLLPSGYRVQSLEVCGANCTTQYWISAMADGAQLLEIDPLRGGGMLAIARTDAGASGADHPQARAVLPSYAAGDPACCPSGFADTTYTWDPSSDTLIAAEPVVTPAAEFPGWAAVRQELLNEGWVPVFP